MNPFMKTISPAQAFKSGADLWIVSDPEHSSWSYKIDWHTGFLMRKIKSQKIKSISTEARASLEKTYKELKEQLKNLPPYKEKKQKAPEISNWKSLTKSIYPDFPTSPKSHPILVESSFYFPNLWTVELPYTPEWLSGAYQIWHSLNRPTLRIFTPQPITAEDIERKWATHAKNITIQYVSNQ